MEGLRPAVARWRAVSAQDVTAASFAVVATVAAAISYDHVQTLAGPVWWAWLLPLSIDGLLVAGSLALWLERRDDAGRGSALTWASVVLGLVASLAANLAATNPLWFPRWAVDVFVAVWPPIALALAFELLVRVRRQTGPEPQPEPDGEDKLPEPESPVVSEPSPPPMSAPSTDPSPIPQLSDGGSVNGDLPQADDDVQAAAVWAASERRAGRRAGRQRIQDERGLSKARSERAASLAARLLAEPEPVGVP